VKEYPWHGVGRLLLIFLALLWGLYGVVLRELVSDWWNDANYSHGFLVPVFSGFLVWQQREALRAITPRGDWLGLPILLAGIGGLVLGDVAAEYFLTRSSLIIVIAGLTLFHLGAEVFRALTFPLVFLFFAVPLPAILFNAVAFPLQGLAAQNATWALELIGVPVLRDGNVIHLSHISLGVTEACSGIRSLISLLALAVTWAYLMLPGVWSRAILVISTVPITIFANALRVILTGLIGQWFGVQYAQGFFHSFEGWVIFLIAFVCLIGIQGLSRFIGRRKRV
jgi:exosortase